MQPVVSIVATVGRKDTVTTSTDSRELVATFTVHGLPSDASAIVSVHVICVAASVTMAHVGAVVPPPERVTTLSVLVTEKKVPAIVSVLPVAQTAIVVAAVVGVHPLF